MLLVVLIGYGVWWMRESNETLNEAAAASRLSDAYEDALQAILETQVVSNDLLSHPTPELRRAFDVQVYRAAAALAFIQTNGNDADRILVQLLLNEYAPKLPEVSKALDAAVAGEAIAPDELPPTALIGDLKRV